MSQISRKLKYFSVISYLIVFGFIPANQALESTSIPLRANIFEIPSSEFAPDSGGMVFVSGADILKYYYQFYRKLNASSQELEEYFSLSLYPETNPRKKYQNHSLGYQTISTEVFDVKCYVNLSCWDKEITGPSDTLFAQGIHVLKNQQVAGYALLQLQALGLYSNYPGDRFSRNILQQIMAFKQDNFIRLPSKKTKAEKDIKFYVRKNSNGFIERYGVLTYQDSTYIILDAYYPKHLDEWVQSRVQQQLPLLLQNWFNWGWQDEKEHSQSSDKEHKSKDNDDEEDEQHKHKQGEKED